MTEKEMDYFFFRAPLSPRKKQILLEVVKDPVVLYEMAGKELASIGFTEKERREWLSFKKSSGLWLEEYHSLKERGILFITERDRRYPKRLLVLPDRPWGFLAKGKVPDDYIPSAALIGARICSQYGKNMAEEAGRILADAGIQVVSGAALGIDGAGHRGALKSLSESKTAAGTFGILGCGLQVCYPPENRDLYERIPEQGGLLSEYGPVEKPLAFHFPMRNRLIAAFSDKVIVIEARKRSGSFITVDFALEQGKDIYALPGRATDPLSAGCNELIQNGAGILTSLKELPGLFGKAEETERLKLHEKSESGLVSLEKLVYSCLDSEPKQEEYIIEETHLKSQEVSSALLELELKGLVKRSAGNYYWKA